MFVDVGLYISYILVGACLLTAVIMPLVKAFGDPDSLKKTGMGIGVLVVVFVLAYLMADGTEFGNATSSTSKLVGAGLYSFYILAAGAILGIVYTEVKKAVQ